MVLPLKQLYNAGFAEKPPKTVNIGGKKKAKAGAKRARAGKEKKRKAIKANEINLFKLLGNLFLLAESLAIFFGLLK